jgi:hypothetical protein
MTIARAADAFAFSQTIADICNLDWSNLTEEECLDVAWAYYFFSVQFRENLEIACGLFPEDANLGRLRREECDTDNLSPWDGVATAGEKLNHDEFMRRLLHLSPISADKRRAFELIGNRYLSEVRSTDAETRARSLASYEDGGLERVFRAMLRMPAWANPSLSAFRHFLSEHIRFDSDPDQGHGALSRHLRPDDRILPLWVAFWRLLVTVVPQLELTVNSRPDRHLTEQISSQAVS